MLVLVNWCLVVVVVECFVMYLVIRCYKEFVRSGVYW